MDARTRLRLVLLVAGVLAFYAVKLEHTPPHLHRDEIMFALQAQSIAATGHDLEGHAFPLYFEMQSLGEHVWFHPVLVYGTALFLKVLPFNESVIRLPSVVVGAIDVLLMYFIAARLFRSPRWGIGAALLLALTPAHFMHSRLAMDFIYPVPFVMAWLLCLLIYIERRRLRWLFLATGFLGAGFFSYIAAILTMPLLVAVTLLALWTTSTRTLRPYLVACAGFLCPLLVAAPWLLYHWSFVTDTLGRYQIGVGAQHAGPVVAQGSPMAVARGMLAGVQPSMLTARLSLYWRFFDPAYLFVSGGFARLTNSTRHVGLFLLPFLVFVPLGLLQMLTVRRTPPSLVVFLGFALAPVAACLAVLEPYASDRELVLLPFGVLIAAFGIERLLAMRRRWGRVAATGLLVLIPLHFVFFVFDYFGDYHRRAAFWFDWNHRGGLEEIIRREAHDDRPILLSNGRDPLMAAYWRVALLKHHREDLLGRTVFVDAAQLDLAAIPERALILMNRDDAALTALVGAGQLRMVAAIPEPADPPYYAVVER
jgi:4-amino-4-deoxy-L-arabinose transferase-like glycosyltransferase